MDHDENFLALLSDQRIESRLTPQDIQIIQAKLWEVLSGRAESFTMGGSSSLPIETAQSLLQSACFVIHHGLGEAAEPDAVKQNLVQGDYDTLFRAGLRAIEAQVKKGEALLKAALQTALDVENVAYRETFLELGLFFKRYHYHHLAHEIPCLLDYPLACPVDEALLGIDYINEYIRRLIIENDFCGRFDPEKVALLLQSLSLHYKEDLVNIYEAVTANALALILLRGDILALDVNDRDRRRLFDMLRGWNDTDAAAGLTAVAADLCSALVINDKKAQSYLLETIPALWARLKTVTSADGLKQFFPPLYRAPAPSKTRVTYIDNPLMDNGKLRELIDELTSCRYMSDKIALARENVHSLRDWVALLDICFWDEEQQALFDTLSDEALRQLQHFVARRRRINPEFQSETNWEAGLSQYKRQHN